MEQTKMKPAQVAGVQAADKGDKQGSGKGKQGGRDQEREGMSREEVGRKGGEKVSQDREHMSEIGRKGGQSSGGNKGGNKGGGNNR